MLLESSVAKDTVAAYGADEFLKTLVKMGYVLDYENPKTVLVAIKENFSADEYAQMIDFLLSGASLVGMHETSIYAKNSKRYPGVGAILKMLEFATSCTYSVVGKPSEAFYNESLKYGSDVNNLYVNSNINAFYLLNNSTHNLTNKLHLRVNITNSLNLTLIYHMHVFYSCYCFYCRFESLESQHLADLPFYKSVVLFNYIIQVFPFQLLVIYLLL